MATIPGDEIRLFEDNLGDTRSNLGRLRSGLEDMAATVAETRERLQFAARIEEQAEDFIATIRSLRFANTLLEKVGPLKLVARAVGLVLDRVEEVAQKVRTKADEVDDRIQATGLIDRLNQAEQKLGDVSDRILAVEDRVAETEASAADLIEALDLLGPLGDPLEPPLDDTVAPVNRLLEALNGAGDGALAGYDSLLAEVNDFRNGFSTAAFYPLEKVNRAFEDIRASFAFLSGPMQAAYSALKPVEGLLDAAGLVYKFTVGPVVDWVLDTLGITRIMQDAADAIAARLPFGPDVLDDVTAALTDGFGQIDAFLGDAGWSTDLEGFVTAILDDVLGPFAPEAAGDLRIGTRGDDTLVGRDGVTDVLNGRAGNDVVDGRSGDDLFFASLGDDTIRGGAGEDRLRMKGSLIDWDVTLPASPGGQIVFRHVPGLFGFEVAEGVETFVFDEGRFTETDLRENVIGVPGGSFTGRNVAEFIYATAPARIEGRGGDDRILGSNGADTLIGGRGNDGFVTNDGADLVVGGKGRDAWIFAVDDREGNSTTQVDLVTGLTWDGRDRDTLSGVEDIIMQDGRNSEFFGDDRANRIVTGSGRDWIDGRGGNDTLSGGGGRDLLIGGAGQDRLSGDADADALVAGAAGGGDLYDGGDGSDTLFYGTRPADYDIRPDNGRTLPDLPGAGPLRVIAATGRVEHLSADLSRVIGTDTLIGIERIIGSDGGDTLTGAPSTEGGELTLTIDGGRGDDVLFSNGARNTQGGADDDLLRATGGGSFDGGGGIDTLDTTMMESRWNLRQFPSGAIGLDSTPLDPADTALQVGGTLEDVEVIVLGPGADLAGLLGLDVTAVFGGAGNDELRQDSPGSGALALHGEDGDDRLWLTGKGALHGGAGNDRLTVIASGSGHVIDGGTGDDIVEVRRMNGSLDGGPGYDILSLDIGTASANPLLIDLAAGTLLGTFPSGSFTTTQISATVTGFEVVVGAAETADSITGSDLSEVLVGRGGNDSLAGNGGRDELYGGAGNDSLSGGKGRDLLHGGEGFDTMDGGRGKDTASWAYAAPGTALAGLAASGFGGVTADLKSGQTLTPTGTDILLNIENLTGGGGGDRLAGNGRANVLSGGAGDDTLSGRGGDDVLILGEGADRALGGRGDDLIVLGPGAAVIRGGAGFDTLSLGTIDGRITADLDRALVRVQEARPVPVWADTGSTEARTHLGLAMTPQDVLQADPLNSDSADDLTRVLPAEGSDDRARFEIAFGSVTLTHRVRIDSIERIEGGSSADRIGGSAGKDRIDGGAGRDRLTGEAGGDLLRGGDGADVLEGGAGRDTLVGGAGPDRFVFGADFGRDLVRDFRQASDSGRVHDVLVLERGIGEAETIREFKAASRQAGDDLVYDLGGDGVNVIRLEGVTLAHLTAADIDFA